MNVDQKDENAQARAEEERKQKAIAKKKAAEDKVNNKKRKMLAREADEAAEIAKQIAGGDGGGNGGEDDKKRLKATQGNLTLIYPLIPYKLDFFIEENYENEEKLLNNEIENKKKEALEAAGGDAKKMDFDLQRDCYLPDVKKFSFDLDTVKKNSKGEVIPRPEKTVEEIAAMEFRDQVLERIFRKWEAERDLDGSDGESSDGSFDGKLDLREKYILQERYIKYQ